MIDEPSGERVAAQEAERVRRMELLATRVRKVYGRSVLRSCGLDDMRGRGIVLADVDPKKEFDPGRRLPPAPRGEGSR